jgi:carboxylesterase
VKLAEKGEVNMSNSQLGVLLVHGWTGTRTMMRPLVEPINSLGLPTRMPALRGHEEGSPDALLGLTWQDWLEDGRLALLDLLGEVDRAIIVGHSMGGMIALSLAAAYPQDVDSVVTAGTPGRMQTPFAPGNKLYPLFSLLWRIIPTYNKGQLAYADPIAEQLDDSLRVVPMVAVKQLFDFICQQDHYLPGVSVPLLILQSRADTSCAPESANILFDRTSTPTAEKRIVWFEKSEHGMFLDIEREQVIAEVLQFVQQRVNQQPT